jgi:hypothetical protein
MSHDIPRFAFALLPAWVSACVPGVTLTPDASADAPEASAPRGDAASDRDAGEAGSDSDAGCVATPPGPSIFVIDSTRHLFAFDACGHSMGSVAVPDGVKLGTGANGVTEGGGMALGAGELFVTTGGASVAVFEPDLTPVVPATDAFAKLTVPRGIAYAPPTGALYVGDVFDGLVAYDLAGTPDDAVVGSFPNTYAPSGVAYDADDQTIWAASYVGNPAGDPPQHGVAEFTADGDAADMPDYADQFAPPPHQEPYAITVCTKAAVGSTLVVVGFVSDGSGLGAAAVQPYSVDGARHGAPLPAPFTKPVGVSCNSRGRVYVADVSGLYSFDLGPESSDAGDAGPHAVLDWGLKPPILGVLATN